MSILEKITDKTREDLQKRKKKVPRHAFSEFEDYERQRRNFPAALKSDGRVSIIAEIKKASPSQGVIRPDFNPRKHALQYEKAGAAAISVLTDQPFFQGDLQNMKTVSRTVSLPVLRKDFIIDFYQIEEARAYGADAMLLIAGITSGSQLNELHHAAEEAGLAVLVECYSEEEADRVDFDRVRIFGVNNRDLNSFKVDVHRGISILNMAPPGVVKVSESGLKTAGDLQLLQMNGIHSALIGEHFMRQDDPGEALKKILDL